MPPTPGEARRVVVSVSPMAGRRGSEDRVRRLVELLAQQQMQAEVVSDLKEATDLANGLHAEGALRALVGVGGDGTAAALANGIQPGVPLTLLAAGTSNLLCKQLGLSREPEDVCRILCSGKSLRMDAGIAAGRLFLVMASCGFDAEVVQRVHEHRRRHGTGHISYWSYAKPILDCIRIYSYPEIRVEYDSAPGGPTEERNRPFSARWVFAMNLPRYGWGLPMAPQARGTDGLLDVCALRRGGFWRGLGYAAMIHLGRQDRSGDWTWRQVRRLRMTSEERVPYQLDGDPGGWLPLEIEVLPGRVTFLVPPRLTEAGKPVGPPHAQ
jgi:diacylglycerol kinase family enzyme